MLGPLSLLRIAALVNAAEAVDMLLAKLSAITLRLLPRRTSATGTRLIA